MVLGSMSNRSFALIAAAVLLMPVMTAPAGASNGSNAPWSAQSHRCADSRVTSVGYRLEGAPDSGSAVGFATTLGVSSFKGEHAGVVGYDTIPTIAREHPGDRVQVCLKSTPRKSQYCDPSKDSRGRIYRVYDYRQHASYSGMNSEHDCGGA
jgi:hypothetical protein